jgi:hypothetical protein
MSPQRNEPREVPDAVRALALERRDRFLARENGLGQDLQQQYAAGLMSYRAVLNQQFMRYFSLNLNGDTGEPQWDLTTATRAGLIDSLTDQFDETVSSVEEEANDLLAQTLVDSYNEGYDEGRYLLALAGIDIDALDAGLDPEEVAQTLIDNGVDEVSWADRLTAWSDTYGDKFRTALKAAAVTEATFSETMEMFDLIAAQLINRVVGLAQNELFRADALGSAAAFAYLGPDGQQVWLTREDGLVCAFCASLNRRVTMLQPETDSHTNCRCMKVPLKLLDEYVSDTHELFNTDMSFQAFQALGRGPGRRGSYTPPLTHRYTQ